MPGYLNSALERLISLLFYYHLLTPLLYDVGHYSIIRRTLKFVGSLSAELADDNLQERQFTLHRELSKE